MPRSGGSHGPPVHVGGSVCAQHAAERGVEHGAKRPFGGPGDLAKPRGEAGRKQEEGVG